MATDYIVFIHGVNPREGYFQPTYADELFRLIQNANQSSSRSLQKIALYWDDVNEVEEHEILKAYRESPIWKDFWYREFRENQILRFTSNIALYISRYVGARVADRLNQQVQLELSGYQDSPEDHLHLVSHSLGTFILFDILFASRWDQQGIPGYNSVRAIRQAVYGVEPNWEQGFRLASICTMGLPIGLFSFMDINQSTEDVREAAVESRAGQRRSFMDINQSTEDVRDVNGNIINTHDITPRLQRLLERLQVTLGRKFPWQNFSHPGDPMASPLIPFLPNLLGATRKYLDMRDIMLSSVDLSDVPMQPSSQTLFALLYSGVAHNSYWKSEEVAQGIARTIQDLIRPRL